MSELSPRRVTWLDDAARFHVSQLCMRLLIAAILVSGLNVPDAYAQPPAAEQADKPNDRSCVNDPSWTAAQTPFRIHGNTGHVGPHGLGVFLLTATVCAWWILAACQHPTTT
ncbi:MAG TPA: hypothetical protein VFN13_01890 [Rudaea sp.]|nr:hypothetical protein [Rudaea sp.]